MGSIFAVHAGTCRQPRPPFRATSSDSSAFEGIRDLGQIMYVEREHARIHSERQISCEPNALVGSVPFPVPTLTLHDGDVGTDGLDLRAQPLAIAGLTSAGLAPGLPAFVEILNGDLLVSADDAHLPDEEDVGSADRLEIGDRICARRRLDETAARAERLPASDGPLKDSRQLGGE